MSKPVPYQWPPGLPTKGTRVADVGAPEHGGTVKEDGPQVCGVLWDDRPGGFVLFQYVSIGCLIPHGARKP